MFKGEFFHNPDSNLNCSICIGIDTIRVGFFAWEQSWISGNRLKDKGWRFRRDWPCWTKHFKNSGMRWRHWEGWIDVEVSLPRVLVPNNSNLDYDPWAALTIIRNEMDKDIRLDLDNSVFCTPDWRNWKVGRADITADFMFGSSGYARRVVESAKNATMIHRPRKWSRRGSVKWASKANNLQVSIYDKYAKDGRREDKGKVRFTVCFNERGNKRHLRKYGFHVVRGLIDEESASYLDVVKSEFMLLRPYVAVGGLKSVVSKLSESENQS